MRLSLVWCLGLLLLASAPARAEDDDPPPLVPQVAPDLAPEAKGMTLTERLLLRQQWLMYREYERRSLGVAGPSVALVLGIGAAATSAWLFTEDRNERVGGTFVAIFVAAPLLGVGISLLSERVGKRRKIDREVWSTPPVARVPFRWTF